MRFISYLAGGGLCLVAACSTSPLADPGDLGTPDLTGTVADLTGVVVDLVVPPPDLTGGGQPDLTSGGGSDVECGNQTCHVPGSYCCSADHGFTGTCIPSTSGCMSGILYTCDGTSDCNQPGDVCCLLSSGAKCIPAGFCQMAGDQLCRDRNECPMGLDCCGFSPQGGGFGHCSNVCPISRRRHKQDIRYLDETERRRLHDELLRYPLATWRYKREGDAAPSRLGFIIEDVAPSRAVAADGETVDLYGYTSMAVAALQEQAHEIATLRKEVEALRSQLARRARRR